MTRRALVALAIAAALAAPLPFVAANVFATADAPVQTKRSEGEDLYRRGYYSEAIAWWTAEAAKGDVEAARRLGVEYMDGKGNVVQRDYEKARQYHMQAARGGERRSMFDLGTMYEHALGVEQNLTTAAGWYEWSAKYGFAQGQYNFATMLDSGDGGRKDEVEAYMYYLLAAAQGVGGLPPLDRKTGRLAQDGDTPIQQLARRMTQAQIAEAAVRAKAFKAMSGPMPA